MVLGIGPSPIDAPSGPEAVLGTHHYREKEQKVVSDVEEGPIHVTFCA